MKGCKHRIAIAAAVAAAIATAAAPAAEAKLYHQFVLRSQFGRQVNLTEVNNHGGEELEDICTTRPESGDVCQAGVAGSGPGGFNNPQSVAIGSESTGSDVYVADELNHRVQVFGPDEKFLFMIGREVDKTTGADICTKASGDTCGVGQTAPGGPAGELNEPMSIAVDRSTGDVYVFDAADFRVDKLDGEGHFVWMIGGDVNKTKVEQGGATEAERNICTATSGDTCQTGQESAEGSTAHGAFRPSVSGDLIAVGGPAEPTLYVGGQGRIQKFDPSAGAWIGEVPLTALAFPSGYVKAVAVAESGDLYVENSKGPGGEAVGVDVLDPAGALVQTIDPGKEVHALALDPFGRLAVAEVDQLIKQNRGVLFDTSSGARLGGFRISSTIGIAFNPSTSEAKDELYAATGRQMVEVLEPVPVAVPVTGACKNRAATSLTLTGEVNAEGVSETRARFVYGNGLAQAAPWQPIQGTNVFEGVEATVDGLRPNETYSYALTAEDKNYKPAVGEEPLIGATLSCETLYVPPLVTEEAQSYYVGFASADVYGALNPENAHTVYRFQYGECGAATLDECSNTLTTPPLESSEYRTFGVMQALTGLQPATTYRYRLIAESENASHTEKATTLGKREGELTTLPVPSPTVATGPPAAVTSSTAVLSGSLDGGGAAASYSFQTGVYDGAATVYGVVVSGQVPAGEEALAESYELAGLQPGVTYAYRLVLTSPYVNNPTHTLVGEPVLFTTAALPVVFSTPSPVALLPSPAITFPSTPVAKGRRPAKHEARKKAKGRHKKGKRPAARGKKSTSIAT